MKFVTTPAFNNDYRRLKAEHATEFKKAVREKFVPACDPTSTLPHRYGGAQLAGDVGL